MIVGPQDFGVLIFDLVEIFEDDFPEVVLVCSGIGLELAEGVDEVHPGDAFFIEWDPEVGPSRVDFGVGLAEEFELLLEFFLGAFVFVLISREFVEELEKAFESVFVNIEVGLRSDFALVLDALVVFVFSP